MKPRRPAPLPAPPAHFPPENVLVGYTTAQLAALGRVWEQVHFVDGDFSGAHLNHLRLEDCRFERCNLSNVRLDATSLQNVAFQDCKLLGVNFSACNELLFRVHFQGCQLQYAQFGGRRLAGTVFQQCSLPEADFTNADLTGAAFPGCDLARAVFHDTNLSGADFTTAHSFQIDPEANTLTGARFALEGLPGLLTKYGVVVG